MIDSVVIVSAARTPIGAFCGALSSLPAHELGSEVIKTLVTSSELNVEDVDEIIMGQVLTAGQGQNPARQAAIQAGIPETKTAWGINQVCGSGLRAVALGMQQILCGDARVVIAGGQENMSLSSHCTYLRKGKKIGKFEFDDTMIKDGLWDAFHDYHMGLTAENIAKDYLITREQQDNYALHSQEKALQAIREGSFNQEIVPIAINNHEGQSTMHKDEGIRLDANLDSMSKLRPVFLPEGTVTAANSSGLSDGAAAVLMMKESEAHRRGLSPLGRIASWASAGVAPRIMGTGPIPASKLALSKAGWKTNDLDLIESNEAFAAQACAVNQAMDWDTDIVNINGGAIALGHPIGASGCRIAVTLLHALRNRQKKKGLATLCIGGGMGIAMAIEAL